MPGRIVIPGSAGVPPAPDLAGRWRLASQTWSVHRMTGTGQQLYKNAGGTPALPGGEPTASQVQIHPEPADHDPCPPIVMPDCEFCKRLLGVVDPEKTSQAGEGLLLAEKESAVATALPGPAAVVDHAVGNKGVVARGLPHLHVPLTDVA